jgi:hypothetical protein
MSRLKQNKTVIVLAVLSLCIYLGGSRYRYSHNIPVASKPSYYKNIPAISQEGFLNINFKAKDYRKKIMKISKNKRFHMETGKSLYNLAFTQAETSKEKISLLRMSKEHLFVAKGIGF